MKTSVCLLDDVAVPFSWACRAPDSLATWCVREVARGDYHNEVGPPPVFWWRSGSGLSPFGLHTLPAPDVMTHYVMTQCDTLPAPDVMTHYVMTRCDTLPAPDVMTHYVMTQCDTLPDPDVIDRCSVAWWLRNVDDCVCSSRPARVWSRQRSWTVGLGIVRIATCRSDVLGLLICCFLPPVGVAGH